MTGTASIEGAIAALRGGRAVHVDEEAFLSIETGSAATLSLVDSDRSARILISGERAAALGLGNILDAADPSRPAVVQRDAWLDRETVIDLVDPARDLARGPFGPLRPGTVGHVEPAMAALKLSRLAGLLPALWWLDARSDGPAISATAILDALPAATIVSRARLPLDNLDSVQIVAFRDSATGEEHVALIVGAFGGRPPLVRLHSECLTGDVFGSLKCDCGPQLHAALQLIAADGGGVLLYLRQEGRGIGLANKIRAYQLQDRGLDTVDANRRLGFPDDTRDYGLAAAMLRALGISAVRLLTNNPTKLEGLAAAGIRIVERVAHHMPVNPHNADYLATKRDRSGHLA